VTYLLDTNVVSEVMRRLPNPGVAEWFSTLDTFSVSAVTLEELVYGLRRRSMLAKEAWLRRMLADKADVVPVTVAAAHWSGERRAVLEFRKFTTFHARHMGPSRRLRQTMPTIGSAGDFERVVDEFLEWRRGLAADG